MLEYGECHHRSISNSRGSQREETLVTRVRRKTFMKKVVFVQQFFKIFCFVSFTFIWLAAVKRLMEEEI